MGQFDTVIRELELQRDKIDKAIAALTGLSGPNGGAPATKTTKAKVSRRIARKADSGGISTRDLVMDVLKSGPKRSGAVIKALKGKATDQSVYAMLNYLKAKGDVKKNDDATFQIN